MRLLYLSPWFPFPPTNGSELRINALLRGLAARHEVTLISFQRRSPDPVGLAEARDRLAEVRLIPWRDFTPGSRRARLGYLSVKPRSVVDTNSSEMAACIRQVLNDAPYDVIIASELDMAAYWPHFGGVPAVLEDLELGVYRPAAEGEVPARVRARRSLTLAKQRAYVRGLLPHFAACTVVSERERALVAEIAPHNDDVHVMPNCINLADYAPVRAVREPNTLIFTGAFTYGVNYDAMVWFLGEVFPLLRREIPRVRLIITGDHGGLPLPPAENVTLTGYIDDVKTAVAGAAVSIVPIRQGGGTRLKILEAMALGTPVVSTTKGAEGLAVSDGQHLLLADNPDSFAGAILSVIRDDSLRRKLVEKSCLLIREKYDWGVVMPEFLNLVESAAGRKKHHGNFHAFL